MKLCLNYGCVERNSREYRKAYSFDLGEEGWDKYVQEVINEIENEKTFDKFVDRIDDFWW
jgi:hypothetical protein